MTLEMTELSIFCLFIETAFRSFTIGQRGQMARAAPKSPAGVSERTTQGDAGGFPGGPDMRVCTPGVDATVICHGGGPLKGNTAKDVALSC